MKKIAITNQKGGVGKTTTTINLSAALAEKGYSMLIVDLDPQGNASTGLGVEVKYRLATTYDLILSGKSAEDCIVPTQFQPYFDYSRHNRFKFGGH